MSKILYYEQADFFAKQLLDTDLKALGFQYFYKHRWIKIINDEVMIWFGLLPYSTYCYEPVMAIVPLFIDPFCILDADGTTFGNWPFNFRLDQLKQNMKFSKYGESERYFMKPAFMDTPDRGILFSKIQKESSEADKRLFHEIAEPVINRIVNLETAIKELVWVDYIMTRWSIYQKQPPTPENYGGMLMWKWAEEFCAYFKTYDLFEKVIYPGLKYPTEAQDLLYNECFNKEFDRLEEKLQEQYVKTMTKIKRRLKYEPKERKLFAYNYLEGKETPDFLHVSKDYWEKVDSKNGCIIRNI